MNLEDLSVILARHTQLSGLNELFADQDLVPGQSPRETTVKYPMPTVYQK